MSNQAHKTWAGTLLVSAALYVAVFHNGDWAAAGTMIVGAFLILMAQAPEGKT